MIRIYLYCAVQYCVHRGWLHGPSKVSFCLATILPWPRYFPPDLELTPVRNYTTWW